MTLLHHACARRAARAARPALPVLPVLCRAVSAVRAVQQTGLTATCLLAAASLAACTGSSDAPEASGAGASGELTVLAAASLQEAFEEIGTTVEKDNPGLSVTFDFQGSQDLVASLAQGAPADVLATASTSTMEDATSQSLVGEPIEFATNVLTLIVPQGNPAGVTGLDSSLEGVDLVVCAPEVPCGEATVRLAEALDVTLDPVSQEQKVTDVRGKVESGEAEAGIVYATDAAAATGVEQIDVPDGGVVNHYPVAATAEPVNPQAAQVFIDAVTSDRAQAVLADHGFGPPGGSGGTEGAAATESTPATEDNTPAAEGTGSPRACCENPPGVSTSLTAVPATTRPGPSSPRPPALLAPMVRLPGPSSPRPPDGGTQPSPPTQRPTRPS